jgi:PleD family two-component response regulator
LTADSQLERLRKWVLGEYTIQVGAGKSDVKVNVNASLGIAQWRPGETLQQVIERADASMYKEKKRAKTQGV